MKIVLIISLIFGFLNAQQREALLIGNSNYRYILNLENSSYNLKRLKETLQKLNFDVKIKTDLDSENLEETIDDFASRLSKNSNSIGFFYYTGHGCQVDYQGYLIPINVDTCYYFSTLHFFLI